MTEFCALRAKAYAFLTDDFGNEDYEKNKITNKKTKGTKKCLKMFESLCLKIIKMLYSMMK